MHAMLHKDEGQVGTLEFPGPDVPYETETGIVMTPFNVTSGLPGQDVELNVSGSETPYLVDVNGLSLYISLGDEVGRSNCVQDCPFTWMPLLASGKLVAGEGVTLAKVGVIVLPNGNRQVTYGGLPLYYYAGDRAPGDINGQGQDGLWFLSPP
ncbi:MAG: hypothetical protein EHM70_15185 [Chloroflexota bacterium]|nr:MAG: hypothetical protein EHM70_15185 [Chloroflexota bacterium]